MGNDMAEMSEIWDYILEKNDERRVHGLQRKTEFTPNPPIASLVEFLQESPVRRNLD
ncbi:hypothetical protein D3C84_1061090 [compost metagenome]